MSLWGWSPLIHLFPNGHMRPLSNAVVFHHVVSTSGVKHERVIVKHLQANLKMRSKRTSSGDGKLHNPTKLSTPISVVFMQLVIRWHCVVVHVIIVDRTQSALRINMSRMQNVRVRKQRYLSIYAHVLPYN